MVTVKRIEPGAMRAGIVIGLHWARWDYRDIADMTGIRPAKVAGILLGAGEQLRGDGAALPAPVIAKRYAAGEAARALAEEFGCSGEHVTGIAEGAGLIAGHGAARQRLARQRDPGQAPPPGRLTTGRRVLSALAAHPRGLTSAQAASLDGRAAEIESGGAGRRRVTATYGDVLARLERSGLARRAGFAPGGRGAAPVLWVITARGRAALDDEGKAGTESGECRQQGCSLHSPLRLL